MEKKTFLLQSWKYEADERDQDISSPVNRDLHLPKNALNTFLSFASFPIYSDTMRREQLLSIYSLVGCNSRQYDDVTIEAKIADDDLWSEGAARKYQNLSQ